MSDRTEKHEGESECAVEEFSDDILVRILSLLSLKEAAATSILSTRWRYLWRFAKLSLNFEFDACPSSMELTDYSNEKKESFINWVNTVVDQHSGDIDLFRVKYGLNNSDRISINKWVKFALRNRSLIELDLYLFIWAELSRYKLPRKLFSDDQHVGLKSLKVLHLNSVSVSGKHIHDLLSNAPVLERLSVESSPKLVQLRVSGQSLALKHLTIRGCSKLINLEICGVNLVSLYFEQITKFSKFILRDVPMLVDLYCNSDSAREFFRMFSCCVSQLEVLRMVDSSRFWMFRKDSIHDASYPHIPNIKLLHLKLYIEDHGQEDGGLSNLLLLMEAFLNLQKLVLHVPRHNSYWLKRKIHLQKSKIRLRKYMSRGPRSPHECLKEVEILGYNAFGDHIERLTYLIKHCVALEKIVINCKYSNRDLTLLKKEKISEHEELARTHAMTQLKTHIPSNIEFASVPMRHEIIEAIVDTSLELNFKIRKCED